MLLGRRPSLSVPRWSWQLHPWQDALSVLGAGRCWRVGSWSPGCCLSSGQAEPCSPACPCLCRAPCRDALRSIRLTDTEPQLSLPCPRGMRGVLSACGPSGSAALVPLAALACPGLPCSAGASVGITPVPGAAKNPGARRGQMPAEPPLSPEVGMLLAHPHSVPGLVRCKCFVEEEWRGEPCWQPLEVGIEISPCRGRRSH